MCSSDLPVLRRNTAATTQDSGIQGAAILPIKIWYYNIIFIMVEVECSPGDLSCLFAMNYLMKVRVLILCAVCEDIDANSSGTCVVAAPLGCDHPRFGRGPSPLSGQLRVGQETSSTTGLSNKV